MTYTGRSGAKKWLSRPEAAIRIDGHLRPDLGRYCRDCVGSAECRSMTWTKTYPLLLGRVMRAR